LIKAFGYVRNAIGDNLATFQEFGGYIAKYLAPVIGTVLGGALQVAGKIAGGVIDVIAAVIKVLNNLISGAITGINEVIKAYNRIPFLADSPLIPKPSSGTSSAPSTGSIPFASGFKAPSVPAATIPTIPTRTGTSGGGSGGGVAAAARVAASAAVASAGIPSSFDVGRFRMAENASMGTTINLNVTGAFDKEGTARTIVETLNNSYYRGTGGATALVAI
jgi:hypothetical protein